jgi:cytochrome c oxidase assembly protein subunit 11
VTKTVNKNVRLALVCGVLFFSMVGAAFAAVPLYKMFCQVTGFDGTVRRAEKAPDTILQDRPITVRFDTNVRDMPWTFVPEQVKTELKVGETGLAFFKVTNTGDKAVTGRAGFNVVPETAGPYFQKLECFCFTDQTLKAGETREFPVAYFVAPELASDAETKGIQEITLSYTFYPSTKPKTAEAVSGLGGKAAGGL